MRRTGNRTGGSNPSLSATCPAVIRSSATAAGFLKLEPGCARLSLLAIKSFKRTIAYAHTGGLLREPPWVQPASVWSQAFRLVHSTLGETKGLLGNCRDDMIRRDDPPRRRGQASIKPAQSWWRSRRRAKKPTTA